MDSGIYEISSPSGKRYIGSTKSFKNRWANHRSMLRNDKHHSPALQHAHNKYGLEQLQFKILILCSEEHLMLYEQIAIDAHKPEYNALPNANGRSGVPMSENARKALLKAHIGKPLSDKTKKLISISSRGKKRKPLSADTRLKISIAHIGKKKSAITDEHRKNHSIAQKNRCIRESMEAGMDGRSRSDVIRDFFSKADRYREDFLLKELACDKRLLASKMGHLKNKKYSRGDVLLNKKVIIENVAYYVKENK